MDDSLLGKLEQRLKDAVDNPDPEAGHTDADDVLLEILRLEGYDDIVEIFNTGKFWYA